MQTHNPVARLVSGLNTTSPSMLATGSSTIYSKLLGWSVPTFTKLPWAAAATDDSGTLV
jgi:hypothetical protein